MYDCYYMQKHYLLSESNFGTLQSTSQAIVNLWYIISYTSAASVAMIHMIRENFYRVKPNLQLSCYPTYPL